MGEVGRQLSMGEEPGGGPAPWSPTGIALISVLLSPLPGGVLHALNYARLGKPKLKRLALASNLFTATILFLLAFFASGLMQVFIWTASLLMAAYFYKSQEQLFRQHRSAGGKKASLLLPTLLAVIVPVSLAVGLSYAEDLRYQARFEAARRMMEKGKYLEAEREFRAYQKAYPDDVASYWNLAVVYENLGDTKKAKDELKVFLKKDPSSKEVQEYLTELESIK